jgi:hypothetical protein
MAFLSFFRFFVPVGYFSSWLGRSEQPSYLTRLRFTSPRLYSMTSPRRTFHFYLDKHQTSYLFNKSDFKLGLIVKA